MTLLFTPAQIGRIEIANRIVTAPMTRSRAKNDGVIRPMTATYYAQRATAGLIVTEGVFPELRGKGYVRTPGLASETQRDAWKPVTAAVHAEGGKIFAQLMHTGRISHPALQPKAACLLRRQQSDPRDRRGPPTGSRIS